MPCDALQSQNEAACNAVRPLCAAFTSVACMALAAGRRREKATEIIETAAGPERLPMRSDLLSCSRVFAATNELPAPGTTIADMLTSAYGGTTDMAKLRILVANDPKRTSPFGGNALVTPAIFS